MFNNGDNSELDAGHFFNS